MFDKLSLTFCRASKSKPWTVCTDLLCKLSKYASPVFKNSSCVSFAKFIIDSTSVKWGLINITIPPLISLSKISSLRCCIIAAKTNFGSHKKKFLSILSKLYKKWSHKIRELLKSNSCINRVLIHLIPNT
eukprot:NODE_152_length_16986_cov_0.478119.p12 type:complete len:130 gc:universal NODE_152_length_16986_cov_0.478119:10376-10765(+)